MRSFRVLVAAGLMLAVCLGSAAQAATDQVHEVPSAMSVDIAAAPFVPLAVDAIVADLQTELEAPFTTFLLDAYNEPSIAAAAPKRIGWRLCTYTAPRPHADTTGNSKRLITVAYKDKAQAVDLDLSI